MRTALPWLLCPFLACAQDPGGPEPTEALPDEGEGYAHVERFIEILETVRENHPDPDSVTYEHLINHALEGMLGSLDKFSAFYHPETYSYIVEQDAPPELPGLGLTLGKSGRFLSVAAVRVGSAAARAKITPGDRILRIGDDDTAGLPLEDAMDKLAGQPGEEVRLDLQRAADRERYEVTLLRAVVRTDAVTDALILERSGAAKVGYIHLNEFTATAHRELEAALDELEDQGMKSLILDLRGNPGGLLGVSVEIAGEFLPPATEVVFTRGRNPQHSSPPMKTPERKRRKRDYPLVVLIDQGSASASELVSGALQDLERATIVGETSYGKGSVQNIMPMGNGTALRLTIAKYHTPSGRTPHEVGIAPDVAVEIDEEDRELLDLWRRRKALSPAELKRIENWKDPVLAAALESLAK